MRRIAYFIALSVLVPVIASCSKSRAEQMAMADNVKVTCHPEVLEAKGGKIEAAISVTYPKGYFHPEAAMVVTPVLVYEGGTQTGDPVIYQGEHVKDNNITVKSDGGTVTQKCVFNYVKGVEKSQLELRCVAFYGDKRIEIPVVKVADGCNTTSMLVDLDGVYNYKQDDYQEIVRKTTEGQIMYDVNSSNVRSSQLSSENIKEFRQALAEINDDSHYTVTGTKIIAYASPEGGEQFNAELSDRRAESARKAWSSISKGMDFDEISIQSIGQDWEGFKEAIANSKIQDKELILRVLSMYSDPAVRESEIRNMSQIYTEINKKVFPELRRARFVTEVEYQNFTEAQLKEASERALVLLDEEGLLRVAANTEDTDRKRQLYKHALQAFDSERALYNLAMMSLDANEPAVALTYLDRLKDVDPDAVNARGVAALQHKEFDKAEEIFKSCATPEALCNLGALDIMKGNYAKAVEELAGDKGTNKALSAILTGDLDGASAALTGDDALSNYLRAIIGARRADASAVKENLDKATSADASLKERAAKDIEFADFR